MHFCHPILEFDVFLRKIENYSSQILENSGEGKIVFPVALIFTLDSEHGGDNIAKELIKRIVVNHLQSGSMFDFYYFGWGLNSDNVKFLHPSDVSFDIEAFCACKHAVEKAAPNWRPNGNADIIIVDVYAGTNNITIDFKNSISIDISSAIKLDKFTSLGSFLQKFIDSTKTAVESSFYTSPSVEISDRLGFAYAKESFIEKMMNKFGNLIGANTLMELTTKNLGVPITTEELLLISNQIKEY